jgi:hypothetical protein
MIIAWIFYLRMYGLAEALMMETNSVSIQFRRVFSHYKCLAEISESLKEALLPSSLQSRRLMSKLQQQGNHLL